MLGVNGIPFNEHIMTEVLRFMLGQARENQDVEKIENLSTLLKEIEEDQAGRRGVMTNGNLWSPESEIADDTVNEINLGAVPDNA